MSHLSPQIASIVLGAFLPLVAGLVTRSSASPAQRAVVHLALSAISSFGLAWIAAATSGTPFDVWATALSVLGTFGSGVLAHVGWWRPTGASAAVISTGGFIGSTGSSAMETHLERTRAVGRRPDGSLPDLADEPVITPDEI